MGTSHIVLEAKNITKIYKNDKEQDMVVFEDSSFRIFKGETISIVGSSGCGKTTLLQVCGLLDSIYSGQIIMNSLIVSNISLEEKTKIRKKNIGFVYQMHHLFPEFSALENVMIPLLVNNEDKKSARTNAIDLLEKLGLYNKINNMPYELSGGEKQRVAISRAIIHRPQLILADEPTGNLDSENSEKTLNLLLSLVNKFNLSLLMVTHNIDIAKRTNRVLTIRNKKIENY